MRDFAGKIIRPGEFVACINRPRKKCYEVVAVKNNELILEGGRILPETFVRDFWECLSGEKIKSRRDYMRRYHQRRAKIEEYQRVRTKPKDIDSTYRIDSAKLKQRHDDLFGVNQGWEM